jgi:hypothetical protein
LSLPDCDNNNCPNNFWVATRVGWVCKVFIIIHINIAISFNIFASYSLSNFYITWSILLHMVICMDWLWYHTHLVLIWQ